MIDVGSSTVARGVVNLVLGCLNNLVIEMAFLIQVIIKMSQVIGTHKICIMSIRKVVWKCLSGLLAIIYCVNLLHQTVSVIQSKKNFCRPTQKRNFQKSSLEHVELTIWMHPNQSR